VFFIAAAVYVFGAAAYIVLASGEIQPWARSTKPDVMLQDMDGVNGGEKIYNPAINGHALESDRMLEKNV